MSRSSSSTGSIQYSRLDEYSKSHPTNESSPSSERGTLLAPTQVVGACGWWGARPITRTITWFPEVRRPTCLIIADKKAHQSNLVDEIFLLQGWDDCDGKLISSSDFFSDIAGFTASADNVHAVESPQTPCDAQRQDVGLGCYVELQQTKWFYLWAMLCDTAKNCSLRTTPYIVWLTTQTNTKVKKILK